jgi:hypothetical protein
LPAPIIITLTKLTYLRIIYDGTQYSKLDNTTPPIYMARSKGVVNVPFGENGGSERAGSVALPG